MFTLIQVLRAPVTHFSVLQSSKGFIEGTLLTCTSNQWGSSNMKKYGDFSLVIFHLEVFLNLEKKSYTFLYEKLWVAFDLPGIQKYQLLFWSRHVKTLFCRMQMTKVQTSMHIHIG